MTEEVKELRKCSRCHSNVLLTFFTKNRKGVYKKTCNTCRNRVACDLCDYKCSSNSDLNKHKKQVHLKIQDFKCKESDCEFKCSTNVNLQTHINSVHKKIRNFSCSEPGCEYKCSDNSNLQSHIDSVHKKIKDFECKEIDCKYKCSINSNLQTHIHSVHNKIKDFECKDCEFKCSTNGHLKRHTETVHLKIRNFSCSELDCEYKCSNNSDLQKHIKQVHIKIKDCICSEPECEYKCSNNSDLIAHIKSVHLKIKEFICSEPGCTAKFTFGKLLKIHVESVHLNIKNFTCEKCDYEFYSNSNFKTHSKICTGKSPMTFGEFKVESSLNNMKLKYIYDKSYAPMTTETGRAMRFDFLIPTDSNPLVIEYDGRQHTQPVKYWGGDEGLIETQELDAVKNKYCDDNDILMLRIPHTDTDNIEELVYNFIVENTNWIY